MERLKLCLALAPFVMLIVGGLAYIGHGIYQEPSRAFVLFGLVGASAWLSWALQYLISKERDW